MSAAPHGPPGALDDPAAIVRALEAVYSPRSTNAVRLEASTFLEEAKRDERAPAFGAALARDSGASAEVRHYGLSMLEFAVRYRWDALGRERAAELRAAVVALAFEMSANDPVLVRNKVAQLWVEAAKRSWAVDWLDMDELLVRLWSAKDGDRDGHAHTDADLVRKGLVLHVLETLSEETFSREDPTVQLRGTDLGQACVEIFAPPAVVPELQAARYASLSLRSGSDGWLLRVADLLTWCLERDPAASDERVRMTALRCLRTLRAVCSWIMLSGIGSVHVVERLLAALSVPSLDVQTAALETLIVVFARSSFRDEDVQALLPPIFTADSVVLLKNVFEYSAVSSVDDLDDAKYTLNKKVTELFSYLGSLLEGRLQLVTDSYDIAGFFSLLLQVMQHPSLLVTIPVLHVWTKFLRSRLLRDYPVITNSIGGMLEICSQRLIRYESFPDDSEDETYKFLNEDIDTVPERHAFLGNYRRYCTDVIEVVVKRLPVDAMKHILQQAMTLFQAAASEQAAFRPETFSKNDPAVLRIDAQITVIDAATKGYLKWLAGQGPEAERNEHERTVLQDTFEQYGRGIMSMTFQDPEMKRKIFQLLVNISTKPLMNRPSFASNILDHLMQPPLADQPDLHAYSEAVRSLMAASIQEMIRLGMMFPDHFLSMYDELNHRIESIVSDNRVDERLRIGYQAFLFVIVHRSTGLDPTAQQARLKQTLEPIKNEWQKPEIARGTADFSSFCNLLGFSQLGEYVTSRRFHETQDWSDRQLDAEGKALQALVVQRCDTLPLRLTKAILAASTDKVEEGSPQWETACALWSDLMFQVLPNLLQLISYAQQFSDMRSWQGLPEEIQAVIKRILTDRFWQSGISTESRDAFFARVSSSKSSFEGFASSVRGSVRQIRETGYWIVYGFVRFRARFYGIPDLAGPLSQALFVHATALSSHHFSVLLNMAVQLIQGCPPTLRQQFLPQIVAGLFMQLDGKITGEWETVNRMHSEQSAAAAAAATAAATADGRASAEAGSELRANGDSLGDEMKKESILRNLTYTAVSFAYSLLDPHAPEVSDPSRTSNTIAGADAAASTTAPRMHEFIISTPQVTEPLLMFLRNAIRYQDTRSCTTAVRALRATIPFLPLRDPQQGAPLRRFLGDELLKAAITSLHEPYFVDAQKDLASLIAQILAISPSDSASTSEAEPNDMPLTVLLSLPGLTDRLDKVEYVLSKLRSSGASATLGERHTRAMVLDLLREVRGLSIQESGRIVPDRPPTSTRMDSGPSANGAAGGKRRGSAGGGGASKGRSKLHEQYMSVDEAASAGGIGGGGDEGLVGVADMFQEPPS